MIQSLLKVTGASNLESAPFRGRNCYTTIHLRFSSKPLCVPNKSYLVFSMQTPYFVITFPLHLNV